MKEQRNYLETLRQKKFQISPILTKERIILPGVAR